MRLAISVEGQSEEAFFKQTVVPYLLNYGIYTDIIIITTSKDRCGRKNRGGCINIDRVKNEIQKLLNSYDYVTTFYDFYGFSNRPTDNIEELEEILFHLFDTNKFIPYIQKYEFETLLFSEPEYFTDYFYNDKIEKEMKKIIIQYNDIELINDSIQTAPSKRISKLFKLENEVYDKVFHGEGIANDIGLSTIKQKANRFNIWIEKIAGLVND